eukprot:CAMPEP_0119389738 /NCGR_PEP_ID=MMETSP1334-20130426/110664_1 /TAXON_ID=127549 /ORGANISM="Calcidiscus leptoporus, Strain RCC1130" /LENGTH=241 /DNA_ID=CAMNT_0007412065 /DNA_START=79 /DNA_END=801 /DNA_ORIENTATION=-
MRWFVCWDGSPAANRALWFALALRRGSDRLTIYHCSNPGRHQTSAGEGEFSRASMEAKVRALVAESVAVQEIDEVFDEKLAGHDEAIADRILTISSQRRADVLVLGSMGTKGEGSRTFQKHALGKSAHAAVLRSHASCVVLMRPASSRPGSRISFLAAIDGSSYASLVLGTVRRLARPSDELIVRTYGCTLSEEAYNRYSEELAGLVTSGQIEDYAVVPDGEQRAASIAERLQLQADAMLG